MITSVFLFFCRFVRFREAGHGAQARRHWMVEAEGLDLLLGHNVLGRPDHVRRAGPVPVPVAERFRFCSRAQQQCPGQVVRPEPQRLLTLREGQRHLRSHGGRVLGDAIVTVRYKLADVW